MPFHLSAASSLICSSLTCCGFHGSPDDAISVSPDIHTAQSPGTHLCLPTVTQYQDQPPPRGGMVPSPSDCSMRWRRGCSPRHLDQSLKASFNMCIAVETLLSPCLDWVLGHHAKVGPWTTWPPLSSPSGISHRVQLVHGRFFSPSSLASWCRLASSTVLPCFLLKVKHLSHQGQAQVLSPDPTYSLPL